MTTSTDRFSWITEQYDRVEHAVSDEAHVAGMRVGNGMFVALCKARFLAASMDIGPITRCSGCAAILLARRRLYTMDEV